MTGVAGESIGFRRNSRQLWSRALDAESGVPALRRFPSNLVGAGSKGTAVRPYRRDVVWGCLGHTLAPVQSPRGEAHSQGGAHWDGVPTRVHVGERIAGVMPPGRQ